MRIRDRGGVLKLRSLEGGGRGLSVGRRIRLGGDVSRGSFFSLLGLYRMCCVKCDLGGLGMHPGRKCVPNERKRERAEIVSEVRSLVISTQLTTTEA